ncbi:MAG: hypothetical protein NZM40_02580 [Sphingomonadaceae bacterium]|uniref:hypothetical protein n=1 Tax=Thermaurantiacus sp. TaxID=2820283 RepID=UPI00298F1AD0|nr:hypothetical protein [Thermaurantiacus sp.]MCS6986310.1 hypothetical protein [Sphingomonadaceae bacterium]MDW8415759.1 hypothetical protein [Thermaurantiacus sp.]
MSIDLRPLLDPPPADPRARLAANRAQLAAAARARVGVMRHPAPGPAEAPPSASGAAPTVTQLHRWSRP